MSRQLGRARTGRDPVADLGGNLVEFSVRVTRPRDARCVVALAGDVDMYTAPAVESELCRAIATGARDVVVDLTEATFIDSTFLGVLTAAHRGLEALGGWVSIVCGDRNLAKVFEITGLDRVFAIHSTLDDAPSPPTPSGSVR